MLTQKYINDLSYNVVGAAIEVHRHIGPGLLESVYKSCLLKELEERNIHYQAEVRVPVAYKGFQLNNYLTLDILVENLIIVELKAVDMMHPVYEAQLLSYLKLAEKPKGLLINFNCKIITKDLKPLVTEFFNQLPK